VEEYARRDIYLAMRMREENSKSARPICRIDVTAFAGVMFALVAMFLLPAAIVVDSPRTAGGVPVDMAKSSHPITMRGANREDALLVAVQRDGRIWFDRDQITRDQLPARIRERLSHGAEHRVYIRADARAKYGTVVQVLDGVRSAGVEDIAFLVDEQNSLSTHQ
jgi:biopolymer transport protein ExbD